MAKIQIDVPDGDHCDYCNYQIDGDVRCQLFGHPRNAEDYESFRIVYKKCEECLNAEFLFKASVRFGCKGNS